MRFWWPAVLIWLSALTTWFCELSVLVIARTETPFAAWKIWLLIAIWILIVFSFFHAIFTLPAPIPKKYSIKTDEPAILERRAKELSLPQVEYCTTCKILKPLRTHHCRVCGRCILRMDHHCPILQSCVHQGNHKFHLLYLFWPGMLGVYALFLCSPVVYRASARYWIEGVDMTFEEQFITSAEINAVTIVLSVFYLLFYQVKNLMRNRTVIEQSKITSSYENEEVADYSLSTWQENVISLLGPKKWTWFFPIPSVPENATDFFYKLRPAEELQ